MFVYQRALRSGIVRKYFSMVIAFDVCIHPPFEGDLYETSISQKENLLDCFIYVRNSM